MTDEQIKELADKITPIVSRMMLWETIKWTVLVLGGLTVGVLLSRLFT